MEKIAFIVQRYGEEVNGGSETYTRMLAEKMTEKYEVHVLTSCALDYVSWENHFPPGIEMLNGVTVHRFSVVSNRDIASFDELSAKLFGNENDIEDEQEWMELQGPLVPTLIDFVDRNKNNFECFFLMTYLYYPTFKAMPLIYKKTIFIPTAHDEPPIYFKIFKDGFKTASRIGYLTPEEKDFVNNQFDNDDIPSSIIGSGLDIENVDYDINILSKPTYYDYFLYVGRIDPSKGCDELFEYFLNYAEETDGEIRLILIGNSVMDIPEHPLIRSLGYVDEKTKIQYMKHAKLLLMPSYYESLSLVTLESMYLRVPVLVNGHNEVLKGHCVRSNGGLYYKNNEEFTLLINKMLKDNNFHRKIANNAQKYVKRNYTWKSTFSKVNELINSKH